MYINSTQLENYTKGNSTGNDIFLHHLNIASVKRYKSRCTCSSPGLHFWHWTTLPTNHINLCNSNSNVKGCAALSASTSTVPYTQVNRCRKSTQINYAYKPDCHYTLKYTMCWSHWSTHFQWYNTMCVTKIDPNHRLVTTCENCRYLSRKARCSLVGPKRA